eukprot:gene104-5515_t
MPAAVMPKGGRAPDRQPANPLRPAPSMLTRVAGYLNGSPVKGGLGDTVGAGSQEVVEHPVKGGLEDTVGAGSQEVKEQCYMTVRITIPRQHLSNLVSSSVSSGSTVGRGFGGRVRTTRIPALPQKSQARLVLRLSNDFEQVSVPVQLMPYRIALWGTSPLASSLVHSLLRGQDSTTLAVGPEPAAPRAVKSQSRSKPKLSTSSDARSEARSQSPWWWPQPVKWAAELLGAAMGRGSNLNSNPASNRNSNLCSNGHSNSNSDPKLVGAGLAPASAASQLDAEGVGQSSQLDAEGVGQSSKFERSDTASSSAHASPSTLRMAAAAAADAAHIYTTAGAAPAYTAADATPTYTTACAAPTYTAAGVAPAYTAAGATPTYVPMAVPGGSFMNRLRLSLSSSPMRWRTVAEQDSPRTAGSDRERLLWEKEEDEEASEWEDSTSPRNGVPTCARLLDFANQQGDSERFADLQEDSLKRFSVQASGEPPPTPGEDESSSTDTLAYSPFTVELRQEDAYPSFRNMPIAQIVRRQLSRWVSFNPAGSSTNSTDPSSLKPDARAGASAAPGGRGGYSKWKPIRTNRLQVAGLRKVRSSPSVLEASAMSFVPSLVGLGRQLARTSNRRYRLSVRAQSSKWGMVDTTEQDPLLRPMLSLNDWQPSGADTHEGSASTAGSTLPRTASEPVLTTRPTWSARGVLTDADADYKVFLRLKHLEDAGGGGVDSHPGLSTLKGSASSTAAGVAAAVGSGGGAAGPDIPCAAGHAANARAPSLAQSSATRFASLPHQAHDRVDGGPGASCPLPAAEPLPPGRVSQSLKGPLLFHDVMAAAPMVSAFVLLRVLVAAVRGQGHWPLWRQLVCGLSHLVRPLYSIMQMYNFVRGLPLWWMKAIRQVVDLDLCQHWGAVLVAVTVYDNLKAVKGRDFQALVTHAATAKVAVHPVIITSPDFPPHQLAAKLELLGRLCQLPISAISVLTVDSKLVQQGSKLSADMPYESRPVLQQLSHCQFKTYGKHVLYFLI